MDNVAKTDEQLHAQAANLRAEASQLLHQEGLLPLLQSYGRACVIGSYTLDLMTWADLDITLQLPHEKDISTFFALGERIANGFQTTKMSFSNQFIRPDVRFDRGLYWGIRLLYEGRTWKIDLWGYGEQDYQANWEQFRLLEESLANADRMTILRIKDILCRQESYRRDVFSVQIYEAVSKYGVKSVAELWSWLRTVNITRHAA